MTQEDLAYDLRQKYAEIVGIHLEAITNARIEKNYPEYFNALENLFTVVKHKFKKKKTSDDEDYELTYNGKDKEKEKEKRSDLQRYYDLRQTAIKMANDYSTTFLGRTSKPEEVSKVENSLREVEMFLFYVMDKSKMFGSVGYNEGM
jgi:hypothetical protein